MNIEDLNAKFPKYAGITIVPHPHYFVSYNSVLVYIYYTE